MTIQRISIPFDTRKKQGTVSVPVLSKEEFLLDASSIVGALSLEVFNKTRSLISQKNKHVNVMLPPKTTLNQFLTMEYGGLKLISEDESLWLGFIPSSVSFNQSGQDPSGRSRWPLVHYRLCDFPKIIRRNAPHNQVFLSPLPKIAKLHPVSTSQSYHINNVSFLLLFNFYQTKCSLVCCYGDLPHVSLVPVFCRKQAISDVKDVSQTQAKSLSVPFLMGKQSGTFHVPIFPLHKWNKRNEDAHLKENTKSIWLPCFVMLPLAVSFDPEKGLKGAKLCLLQTPSNCFKIGFLPTQKSNKINHKRFFHACFSTLIEPLEADIGSITNHYFSGEDASSIVLGSHVGGLRANNNDVSDLRLIGCSLFLLANEDGSVCGLFLTREDLELKCTRPTFPEEGFFPITRLLAQSSEEELSAKRARAEEQGETSQREEEDARREEGGETSQRAAEESRRSMEAIRDEEARRECAEALIALSQHE